MDELAAIRKRTKPHDILLVLDAMTGQDAVNVAEAFAERVDFDGVLLTKLDGDARGGAALSVKAVTGKPILYASTGEKLDAARALPPGADGVPDPRHGRRAVADREGRGGLGRRRRPRTSSARSAGSSSRSRTSSSRCARCGGWARFERARDDARDGQGDEAAAPGRHGRPRARPARGDHPLDDARRARPTRQLIDGSRRKRIARGSGTTVQAVNQLVKQFGQMRKLMAQLAQGQDARPAAAGCAGDL